LGIASYKDLEGEGGKVVPWIESGVEPRLGYGGWEGGGEVNKSWVPCVMLNY